MNTNNTNSINTTATLAFLLGCIGLVAVIILDKVFWKTGIITEGWPNFSLGHVFRSILICISIFAILWSLIGNKRPNFILDESNQRALEKLSISAVLSLSVIFVFLFLFKPSIFGALSLEDGIIEWGSALLLFASGIITAISFVKSCSASNIPKSAKTSLFLLSLLFIVMAMEEVSWFQRVLEIDTPENFDLNLQNEMNLHNFYTNPIENIYYTGAFLFLVLLPFGRLVFSFISNNNYLNIFVARPFVGIIGSIACAYNFDMWNIIYTQITFFSSVMILFIFYIFNNNRTEKYLISFTVLLIIVTQAIFLFNGVNFSRIWEVTEYKEFFIPLAFFFYSLDLFAYLKREQLSDKG